MARLLLVDDDKDIRELGCALLSAAGHSVAAVDGAIAALEYLRDHTCDLLITDANMPLHSGFDLVRTIRKDPRWPRDLTIVMLTARRERKDIERAVELGVHDYIVKPIDPTLFLSKISDLLEKRSPQAPAEFAQAKIHAPAKISVAIEIVSVSESGLIIRSPHPLSDGAIVEIETDLFLKIGIAPPMMRALAPVTLESGFEARVAFVGCDETVRTKIRGWVHATMVRSRAAS